MQKHSMLANVEQENNVEKNQITSRCMGFKFLTNVRLKGIKKFKSIEGRTSQSFALNLYKHAYWFSVITPKTKTVQKFINRCTK